MLNVVNGGRGSVHAAQLGGTWQRQSLPIRYLTVLSHCLCWVCKLRS